MTLEQLMELDRKATQGEWWLGVGLNDADQDFAVALVNFWRAGGREMVRDGLELRHIKELARDNNRLMVEMIDKHAARRTSGDERG